VVVFLLVVLVDASLIAQSASRLLSSELQLLSF
jgi:hypothetical protein